MRIALSLLCENPLRKTGLSSLFHEFVGRSLRLCDDVEWIVYVGPEFDWGVVDPRVEVVKDYPASNRMKPRLVADYLRVGPDAARRGADVLVTVGFVPVRTGGLPVAMHMLSLQHLSPENEVGLLRSSYRKWAASGGLRKADLVITNTEFAIAQILAVNPEAEKKIIQSYEGLQHDFYVPEEVPGEADRLREKFGIEPGYLYWCSNFYPYKQAEKFFDAYAGLTAEERDELPIVMVGGGGWAGGLESAMAHAGKLGIEKHLTRLGWVDDEDLAALYRQARIFCLASREETFGRCVIESMACGTPCIVNAIPVMEEVTRGAAVLVDFNDRSAATEVIRGLMQDKAGYEHLAAAGIERAAAFDFDILARERIAAIRKLLEP